MGRGLILYRITLVVLAPVLAALFALRWLRGKETRTGLAERMALTSAQSRSKKTVWVHGASLGELTAARPLLDNILARDPAVGIVVTMNSYSARQMVARWGNPRLQPRMAPLDYPVFLKLFLKFWSPIALVVLENELWPSRMSACRSAGIPVLVAGGRLSARATSMWARFPALSRDVAAALTYIAPLDEKAAGRFRDFGVDSGRIGPALLLKSGVALPNPDPTTLSELRKRFDRAQTVLAASTHDGEDALILNAFCVARAKRPDLRLILAPRHPDRAPDILRLISNHSLPCQQRSQPRPIAPDTLILLADTLGEMALWYSLAGTTLVGGTWVEKGGHTPFEPAQFGSAIVHGPSVHNHAQAFATLDAAGGAVLAPDTAAVAQAILNLADVERRAKVARSAAECLAPLRAESRGITQFVERLADLTGTSSVSGKS